VAAALDSFKIRDQFLVGVYDDDEKTIDAVTELQRRGFRVADVFSPFPLHGLDLQLGYKKSRLPQVAFWAGAVGCALALGMQVYMLGLDWQIDIGGKPYTAIPSFIPVTFELTVLIASLTMVGTYLYVNRLAPAQKAMLADIRQTDDRFAILVKKSQDAGTDTALRQAYNATGAVDVRDTELEILETEIHRAPAHDHDHDGGHH
jgi:hypothetical protein